jgi:hypothetical protein
VYSTTGPGRAEYEAARITTCRPEGQELEHAVNLSALSGLRPFDTKFQSLASGPFMKPEEIPYE